MSKLKLFINKIASLAFTSEAITLSDMVNYFLFLTTTAEEIATAAKDTNPKSNVCVFS